MTGKQGILVNRFIRPKELTQITGLSNATLWRQQRDGEFPPMRKIGNNAVGVLLSDVEDWLASRPVVPGNREREQG